MRFEKELNESIKDYIANNIDNIHIDNNKGFGNYSDDSELTHWNSFWI